MTGSDNTSTIDRSDSGTRQEDPRQINVGGGDLHRMVTEAWDALVAANDEQQPRVMVRGNELVRMTERGDLEPYSVHSLRDELSRVAEFGRWTVNGWSPQKPPREIADTLLARDSADYPDVPRVDRVVDVPVLATDGEITWRPGHHPESRIFFRPAPDVTDIERPSAESVDEVIAARDLLMDDLLGDFAFDDDASKANALGLLLLPFVREHIGDDPTPMHLILAPEPGTGKTLLAQTALLPGCGIVPVTAGSRNHNDEWRKSLTASLLRGTRAIVFDNLSGVLDSGPLAAAITSGVWRDRVLGYSREVTLPVRNAWVATGNNLDVTDEHARRAVPIFLNPGDVRPADRPKAEFRHADLPGWAREHRAELVQAALTLVHHWMAGYAHMDGAGTFHRTGDGWSRPERTLGSFEHWSHVIGGILQAADVPGFLGNRERLMADANIEQQELRAFFEAWHGLGREPMTIQEVTQACFGMGALYDALPTELAGIRSDKLQHDLQYWLRKNKDRRAGGFQLLAQDDRPKRWLVRKLAP